MPGTRWGDLRTSQHSAGRTNSEYRATQLQLLKAREWAARFSPFETPGEKRHRAQWEKLERRAERELERRSLGSRGSARTERSRPATVPSEPSPSTIDSAQRPGSGYRFSRPSTSDSVQRPESIASLLPPSPPTIAPDSPTRPRATLTQRDLIRLQRRPKMGKAKKFGVLANGNRRVLRDPDSDSDDEHYIRAPAPPPPERVDTCTPPPVQLPERYRCVAVPGAIARTGVELTSEDTEEVVYTGDVITALEHGASQSGTVRVRCELGWVSVTGSNGQPVLTPTEDDTVTVGRQLSPEEQAAEAAAAEEAEEEAWRQRLLAGHYMYSHKSLTSMTEEQIVASSPRDGPNRPGSRCSGGAAQRVRAPPQTGRPGRTGKELLGPSSMLEEDKMYPSLPKGSLGVTVETQRLQKQLKQRERMAPPSSSQTVSNRQQKWEHKGTVIRAATWQRSMRNLKHRNPMTGAGTSVRPAVGMAAADVEEEEKRSRGSIMLFAAMGTGHQKLMWVRKGHVNSKPVDSSGNDAVGGRVGIEYRHTSWQSPNMYFERLDDIVEEAEESSRKRQQRKAARVLQEQMEREAARKIWVRGEQVELPPTPPPRQIGAEPSSPRVRAA